MSSDNESVAVAVVAEEKPKRVAKSLAVKYRFALVFARYAMDQLELEYDFAPIMNMIEGETFEEKNAWFKALDKEITKADKEREKAEKKAANAAAAKERRAEKRREKKAAAAAAAPEPSDEDDADKKEDFVEDPKVVEKELAELNEQLDAASEVDEEEFEDANEDDDDYDPDNYTTVTYRKKEYLVHKVTKVAMKEAANGSYEEAGIWDEDTKTLKKAGKK